MTYVTETVRQVQHPCVRGRVLINACPLEPRERPISVTSEHYRDDFGGSLK